MDLGNLKFGIRRHPYKALGGGLALSWALYEILVQLANLDTVSITCKLCGIGITWLLGSFSLFLWARASLQIREVRLLSTFTHYCRTCGDLLWSAKDDDVVHTIQSLLTFSNTEGSPKKKGADRDAFDKYMIDTRDWLLHTKAEYRRIVIVDREESAARDRIQTFVRYVVTEIVTRIDRGEVADHSNISIGFAGSELVSDHCHLFLDVITAGASNCAIAFLWEGNANAPITQPGALRIKSKKNGIPNTLHVGLNSLWEEIARIHTQVLTFDKDLIDHETEQKIKEANSDDRMTSIMHSLCKECETKVNAAFDAALAHSKIAKSHVTSLASGGHTVAKLDEHFRMVEDVPSFTTQTDKAPT